MKSRVRFSPHSAPNVYSVEFKRDGWFQPWLKITVYKDREDAIAFAKTFQAEEIIWSSDTREGVK